MGSRTAERWIGNDLSNTLAGQGLADITTSDVLLEPREDLLESRETVAK
jgi:hypothetical protein